jgi:ubiquitin-activating enzyme E1
VVVLTDSTFDVALKINDFCHANNIRFLSTQSRGVFGNIFVDFGTDFVIYDNNGETPTSAMVSAITQADCHLHAPPSSSRQNPP